jgi:hypothetical protein
MAEAEEEVKSIHWNDLDTELQQKGWPTIKGGRKSLLVFICDVNDKDKLVDYQYSEDGILIAHSTRSSLERRGILYMIIYRKPFNPDFYFIKGAHLEIPQRPPGISD